MTRDIAKRFKAETAEHQMEVLHDDGLYRHIAFRHKGPNYSGYYWFDLITVPGALIFQGDGESFVFRRLQDMFAFFRGSAHQGRPNVQYWAEKLTDGRDRVTVYQQELLNRRVKEAVNEAVVGAPKGHLEGLEAEVTREVLDELIGDETYDRKLVDDFAFYLNEDDRWKSDKHPDFRFNDSFEWQCTDYDWWFLWACHAIVWGIAQYDERKAAPVVAS